MKILLLFWVFFKIGLFGFGGGLAMLPLMYQSIQQFGLMEQAEFSNLLALSQVTPGPIAVNAATYVGLNYAGFGGAVSATIGVMLPAFIIMLIVARMLDKYKTNRIVQGAFEGIRPVTVGLVASAMIFVSQGVLVKGSLISMSMFTGGMDYYNPIAILIMVVTVVLMLAVKARPIIVMLAMAVVGAVLSSTGLMT